MHCDVKASVAASSHTACAVAPVAIFVFLSLRRSPSPFFLLSLFPTSLLSLRFGLGKCDDALLMLATAMASFLPPLPSFDPNSSFCCLPPPSRSRAATAGIITCNGKIAKPLLSSADSQSCKSSLVNLGLLLRAFVGFHCLSQFSRASVSRQHRLSSAELPPIVLSTGANTVILIGLRIWGMQGEGGHVTMGRTCDKGKGERFQRGRALQGDQQRAQHSGGPILHLGSILNLKGVDNRGSIIIHSVYLAILRTYSSSSLAPAFGDTRGGRERERGRNSSPKIFPSLIWGEGRAKI